MNKFRRGMMWLGLVLIILLILLSIYGAFLGAARARAFFNGLGSTVYWSVLAVALIVGIATFRRLVRVPALLLMHLGCVLIIAGSMWASEAGHKLQKRLLGTDKIPTGQMRIFEGYSENRVVMDPNEEPKKLPFSVRLKDFRVEHYKPEYLKVETHQGQSWKIPVEVGSEFSLGPDFGTVTIVRAFENFKISFDGDKRIVIDDPEPGYNPALEVQIEHPDGSMSTQYAFERFPGHAHRGDRFILSYRRVIREYVSELEVIRDDKVVAEKDIEVNHPLGFGGYHFYQDSYDSEAGQYTILRVVSDSGLNFVYAGYLMLGIGVFWHLWLRESVRSRTKPRSK